MFAIIKLLGTYFANLFKSRRRREIENLCVSKIPFGCPSIARDVVQPVHTAITFIAKRIAGREKITISLFRRRDPPDPVASDRCSTPSRGGRGLPV